MSQSQEIDGVTYEVRHLPPDDALRTFIDIGKMGGGGLIAAIARWDELAEPSEVDPGEPAADAAVHGSAMEVIAKALGEIIAAADPVIYLRIIESLMRAVSADGKPMLLNGHPVWKVHFQGKLGTLRKVVLFAMKVNFADFFGGGATTLTSAIGRWGRGKGSAPSPSPAVSPGAGTNGA